MIVLSEHKRFFSFTVRLPSSAWHTLKMSWLEFARCETELSGLRPFIPFFRSGRRPGTRIVNYNCYCRKSAISFPHWPPSSYQEAVQQLRCVLGENINHRKYLASSWWTGKLSRILQKACIATSLVLLSRHVQYSLRSKGKWSSRVCADKQRSKCSLVRPSAIWFSVNRGVVASATVGGIEMSAQRILISDNENVSNFILTFPASSDSDLTPTSLKSLDFDGWGLTTNH
jgi:hypothetical protein